MERQPLLAFCPILPLLACPRKRRITPTVSVIWYKESLFCIGLEAVPQYRPLDSLTVRAKPVFTQERPQQHLHITGLIGFCIPCPVTAFQPFHPVPHSLDFVPREHLSRGISPKRGSAYKALPLQAQIFSCAILYLG